MLTYHPVVAVTTSPMRATALVGAHTTENWLSHSAWHWTYCKQCNRRSSGYPVIQAANNLRVPINQWQIQVLVTNRRALVDRIDWIQVAI